MRIDLLPSRPGVATDASTTLDVLVRVHPPAAVPAHERPPLDLAIVLDRSGSMAQQHKLAHAVRAALHAVDQLRPGDRVALTVFDDVVETVAPLAPVEAARALRGVLDRVEPGGSTALFAGWEEGARQLREALRPGALCRALLLSDGQANVGEQDPRAIARAVHALAGQGVSTSTIGVGNDYNEDLLEAMGREGDGDYHYLEAPAQLSALFARELAGLMGTVGRQVRLGLVPGPGVQVRDVYNTLERDAEGRLLLPNLVAGRPLDVALRLEVPAGGARGEALLEVRLSWEAGAGRERARARLELPQYSAAALRAVSEDPDVREAVALLRCAQVKRLVVRLLDQGDVQRALGLLAQTRAVLDALPASAAVKAELGALEDLERDLQQGLAVRARKKSGSQAFDRSRSKP